MLRSLPETQRSKLVKKMKNNMMRKFYCFACLCLFALAAIGGIAYLFYDNHAVFGIAAVATSAMAIPYVIDRINELMS